MSAFEGTAEIQSLPTAIAILLALLIYQAENKVITTDIKSMK